MTRIDMAAQVAERTLLGSSLAAMAALAVGLAMTTPAHATGDTMSGAEKLRRLDIMLMVTGLRCRTTADNFTADYGRFTASHVAELKSANTELKASLARRYGAAGAQRALDRLSTTMANGYGQGHPWLGCAELKMVTRNLVAVHGRATLEEAADQLLAERSPSYFALAGR
jgi:hypothetical protein